jgi:hypothetical protein
VSDAVGIDVNKLKANWARQVAFGLAAAILCSCTRRHPPNKGEYLIDSCDRPRDDVTQTAHVSADALPTDAAPRRRPGGQVARLLETVGDGCVALAPVWDGYAYTTVNNRSVVTARPENPPNEILRFRAYQFGAGGSSHSTERAASCPDRGCDAVVSGEGYRFRYYFRREFPDDSALLAATSFAELQKLLGPRGGSRGDMVRWDLFALDATGAIRTLSAWCWLDGVDDAGNNQCSNLTVLRGTAKPVVDR